jgi:hypothetical protein
VTPARYFVEPATPHRPARYCILDGSAVVHTQMSCPDGVEVPRPAHVRWATQPWSAGPAAAGPGTRPFRIKPGQPAGYDGTTEELAAKRQRAQRAGRRRVRTPAREAT